MFDRLNRFFRDHVLGIFLMGLATSLAASFLYSRLSHEAVPEHPTVPAVVQTNALTPVPSQRAGGSLRASQADLAGAAAFDKRDFSTALRLLSPLADRGDPIAQYFVGVMYLRGFGIEADPSRAVVLLSGAATAGIADAQNYVAAFYRRGDHVQKDYAQAMQWYLLAARQDYQNAQYRIALLYDQNDYGSRDIKLAYMWACIASTDENPEAKALRIRLETSLSAD